MSEREVWFHYYSDGGRFKSWAVHWKGWASVAFITALLVADFFVAKALTPTTGWHIFVFFVSAIAYGAILFWLTFAKGKRVRSLKRGKP